MWENSSTSVISLSSYRVPRCWRSWSLGRTSSRTSFYFLRSLAVWRAICKFEPTVCWITSAYCVSDLPPDLLPCTCLANRSFFRQSGLAQAMYPKKWNIRWKRTVESFLDMNFFENRQIGVSSCTRNSQLTSLTPHLEWINFPLFFESMFLIHRKLWRR